MYLIPAVGWQCYERCITQVPSAYGIYGYHEAMATNEEEPRGAQLAKGAQLARGSGDAYPYTALVARSPLSFRS
jgi:hypothetical protein